MDPLIYVSVGQADTQEGLENVVSRKDVAQVRHPIESQVRQLEGQTVQALDLLNCPEGHVAWQEKSLCRM